MKRLFFLMFAASWLSFVSAPGQDQDRNCRQFHNGTFTHTDKETGATTLIERNGAVQTETTDGGKTKAVFNVRWLDECRYTLRPTEETFKRYPDWPRDAVFTVEILETEAEGYRQVSSSSFDDTKVTNDIKKLK